MTPDQIKHNITINLEKLKRRYYECVSTYDPVSLEDLAHSLRIWHDMRNHVQLYMSTNMPSVLFKKYSINAQAAFIFKQAPSTIAAFPGGITTRNTSLDFQPVITKPNIDKPSSTFTNFKISPNLTDITTTYFAYIEKLLSEDKRATLNKSIFDYNKVKFIDWLQAEALRVCIKNEENNLRTFIITRNQLIDRVANIDGGSHPKGNKEFKNDLNTPIRESMQHKMGVLPLPYTSLLKIAYDILVAFRKIPRTLE